MHPNHFPMKWQIWSIPCFKTNPLAVFKTFRNPLACHFTGWLIEISSRWIIIIHNIQVLGTNPDPDQINRHHHIYQWSSRSCDGLKTCGPQPPSPCSTGFNHRPHRPILDATLVPWPCRVARVSAAPRFSRADPMAAIVQWLYLDC